ncbi:MAG: MFS transporter [Actinobacteria bacterium]|nr:MFS transporter [Actinomycetota bacterium]
MLHRALDDSFPDDVRHRITVLTVARTAANSCFRFTPPFLATIARGNGTTLAGIGIAVAISELSGLLSPFNGEVVERIHRRTAMVAGLIGIAVGTTVAACSVHPVMFAVGLILLAQSKVMLDLGVSAWTTDRVPYAQRGRVMGLLEISWAVGLLVGVSVMGLLTAATNFRFGFGLGAAAAAVMASVVARGIAPDSGPHTRATRAPRSPIKVSDVGVLLIGMFFLMAASQALFVTFGSWLEDAFHFTPKGLSVVAFTMGLAELVSSVTSSRRTDAWGKERSATTGAVLMVLATVGISIWHSSVIVALPLVIIAIAVFEFALVSAIPLSTAAIPGSAARGIALMMGAGTLGRAAASIPATQLYERYGMAWPALLSAVLAGGTAISMLALHRRDAPPMV